MIIDTITLDSTLTVTLLDQTRHYFGGYFHVKVLVYCDIPLERSYFDEGAEFEQAVKIMGPSARFQRILEKMAVPEADLASVRDSLISAFHDTTLEYLSDPAFPRRFVRSVFRKCVKKPTVTRSSRA